MKHLNRVKCSPPALMSLWKNRRDRTNYWNWRTRSPHPISGPIPWKARKPLPSLSRSRCSMPSMADHTRMPSTFLFSNHSSPSIYASILISLKKWENLPLKSVRDGRKKSLSSWWERTSRKTSVNENLTYPSAINRSLSVESRDSWK